MAGVQKYRGNAGGQSDGELIDIISFPSHLIIQWTCTVSFPTVNLTHSVRDVVDHQQRVLLYLLTWCLHSSNQNSSFSWIPFGCRERCRGVSMVGSLPSSCIVSPQWPPSGASLSFLNVHDQVLLWWCSSTICGQIACKYIYTETYIIHAILWCSESGDCNKDEYDKTKCLVVV